ncbi:hypothetical protein GRI62_11810 [Erythrobacter arachoides]|uniref:Uncharacterized protein n=1 Tax=Aurantiacibacter arachoides TaxID=1850444 RepID=A0A845A165_9SPHN|nr:hypothetical protein [Aurantiacibacter arachoides]MXO94281.1 hypothetical protein [Aurantiacibacter arachoides]GGD64708.1 hypothetical protein GCM10011411_26270 [Aurantiacibacter arachoides]
MDFLKFAEKDPDAAWRSAGAKSKDVVAERRNKTIEGIDATIKQLKAGEENPPRGWYKMKGTHARVSIRSGRQLIPFNGQTHLVVPREKALDFYQGALKAAKAGDLDDTITAAFDDDTDKPKTKRAGWSPERRAAHQAKMAEKAKK